MFNINVYFLILIYFYLIFKNRLDSFFVFRVCIGYWLNRKYIFVFMNYVYFYLLNWKVVFYLIKCILDLVYLYMCNNKGKEDFR